MKRFRLRRPSAPMIIAIIALVAAIGGTAVAGGPPFLPKKKFSNFKPNVIKTPVTYASVTGNNPAGAFTDFAASCPAGSKVTGGGIKVSNDNTQEVNDSHPTTLGGAGTVKNTGAAAHTAQITAICVRANTSTGTVPSS